MNIETEKEIDNQETRSEKESPVGTMVQKKNVLYLGMPSTGQGNKLLTRYMSVS